MSNDQMIVSQIKRKVKQIGKKLLNKLKVKQREPRVAAKKSRIQYLFRNTDNKNTLKSMIHELTKLPQSNTALNKNHSSNSHRQLTVVITPSMVQPPQTINSKVYQLSLHVMSSFWFTYNHNCHNQSQNYNILLNGPQGIIERLI